MQKFMRAVIGTNNVDQGTTWYDGNTIEVLRDMLGVPAATNSIAELMESDVILVSQTDLLRQLPTIGGWVLRAKLAGAKLIVIGLRRHRVAESADYFLQTIPGTEAFLFGALAKVIVDRGLMNLDFIRQRCKQFEPFLENIESFDPEGYIYPKEERPIRDLLRKRGHRVKLRTSLILSLQHYPKELRSRHKWAT